MTASTQKNKWKTLTPLLPSCLFEEDWNCQSLDPKGQYMHGLNRERRQILERYIQELVVIINMLWVILIFFHQFYIENLKNC